ncbi:NADH-quinone oxidoreductase subunit L [Actinoplanes sp. NPDC049548]|uniref:NADH-quinone oxidoreductase subunit 5 family protein n=1 Tax=Actinoplanes sp. NPDC049548 TaxID=3155152 RepID=UPI0034389FEA
MTADVLTPLLPGVPLLMGLAGLLLPPGDGLRARRRSAALLGVTGAALALLITVVLLVVVDEPVEVTYRWVSFGDLPVTLGFALGPAALYVALAVSVVALFVQIYSIEYLHRDRRYAPYAAQISLFTGAMLLVVAADDLILLLVGWEVMGACSYLLIGHDRRLPEAPAAAVKAFVVTRVGDVGFLLGIAWLGTAAGSFRISDIIAHVGAPTTALLLVLAGVAGKSAQFPLHTWLPDAMAGPTPISALIHAATMVAAGVYVVFRLFPLFAGSPGALAVLGVMAAVTLLLGALSATAQDDIKRVLAWSTVSQIGYMTGALAVGSPAAALFHLLTHAAFKALLFLAAGAVIHAAGTNLMSRMGGLRKPMPVTFWSFVVGLGALAGVPPLAGFWSKENVLVAAAHATEGDGPAPAWVGWVVWVAALAGVAITAWYATRLLLRTFFGFPRARAEQWSVGFDDASYEVYEEPEPHDPPGLMRWPVVLLAVPAALLGLAAFLPAFRAALELDEPHLEVAIVLPLVLLVLGAGSSWWLWRAAPGVDPAKALGRLRPLFAAGFRLDDLQDRFLVRPVRALAQGVRLTDERVVDAAVEGTGTSTTRLGAVLAAAHRAALPRAAVAVFTGALVLGVVAAIYGATS